MVAVCAVIGCEQRGRSQLEDITYFSIPPVITNQGEGVKILSQRRRALWLARINRFEKDIKRTTKVCSKHFIGGQPASIFDELSRNWAPCVALTIEKSTMQCKSQQKKDERQGTTTREQLEQYYIEHSYGQPYTNEVRGSKRNGKQRFEPQFNDLTHESDDEAQQQNVESPRNRRKQKLKPLHEEFTQENYIEAQPQNAKTPKRRSKRKIRPEHKNFAQEKYAEAQRQKVQSLKRNRKEKFKAQPKELTQRNYEKAHHQNVKSPKSKKKQTSRPQYKDLPQVNHDEAHHHNDKSSKISGTAMTEVFVKCEPEESFVTFNTGEMILKDCLETDSYMDCDQHFVVPSEDISVQVDLCSDEINTLKLQVGACNEEINTLKNEKTAMLEYIVAMKAKLEEFQTKNDEVAQKCVALETKNLENEKLVQCLHSDNLDRATTCRKLEDRVSELTLSEKSFENDDEKVRFYTGLPNYTSMMEVYHNVEEKLQSASGKPGTKFQHFIMATMKLRLNFPDLDLAYRFGVTRNTITSACNKWYEAMSLTLERLISYPDRESYRESMTPYYRKHWGESLVIVINYFNIALEKKRNQFNIPNKDRAAVNYLVGVTLQGNIVFISRMENDCLTYQELIEGSGILNNLLPGDVIIADPNSDMKDKVGFTVARLIQQDSSEYQAVLSYDDPDLTSTISNEHIIHVDKVTAAVSRRYTILQSVMKLNYLLTKKPDEKYTILDHMVRVCCALNRLCPSQFAAV